MTESLQDLITGVSAAWGPLTSALIANCRKSLEGMARASAKEGWLAALHAGAPATAELYREPSHRFLLLAHTEPAGLYRPPHDHGRGWVIYAVQSGEVEMGAYGRVEDADGRVRLVKRDAILVRAGQVQVYLPGDIHDTRCAVGPALLFRFSDRDLGREDRQEHRVARYVDDNGDWVPRRA